MTNNSDGLTPTLRPQLGIGFNRALPAPFTFENGWQGDGVNDYFLTRQVSIPFPNQLSFEYWRKAGYSLEGLIQLNNTVENLGYGFAENLFGSYGIGSGGFSQNGGTFPGITFGTKTHIVFVVDFVANTMRFYQNGVLLVTLTNAYGTYKPSSINSIRVGNGPTHTGVVTSPNRFNLAHLDELRLYKTALTPAQIALNYNSGVGNNPCETEHLLLWHNFNEFESLDFSALQDSTDMRLGVRDLSGNNHHSQPFNQDTNPASGTYVLKPY